MNVYGGEWGGENKAQFKMVDITVVSWARHFASVGEIHLQVKHQTFV